MIDPEAAGTVTGRGLFALTSLAVLWTAIPLLCSELARNGPPRVRSERRPDSLGMRTRQVTSFCLPPAART